MSKLEQLMEEYDLGTFELSNSNGSASRFTSLNRVLDGEAEISNVNLNILLGAANGLGVRLPDILEPWDLDGRSGQIVYLNRLVKRAADNNAQYSNVYPNGGFIKGDNVQKQEDRLEGDYINIKTDYEILDPSKSHKEQGLKETYELNREFLNKKETKRHNRNKTIQNFHSKLNANSLSFLIYTPLDSGGDFKTAVSVFDKDNDFLFSEVYGAEWIDKEDQREVVYYKARLNEIISPERIKNVEKEVISELEFFKGLKTQYTKFNIPK